MPSNKTFLQQTTALEKVVVPKVAGIIRAYRRAFIADLQASGKSTATGNLQSAMAPHSLTLLIQAIYKRAGVMGARMLLTDHAKYIQQAQRQQQKGFGKNEEWIKMVIDYLRLHMIRFVQDITETMRNDILRTLEKGVEEGWSIEQTVRELRTSGLIEARARVIARTEIIRAANVGYSSAAKTLPYEVDKKWSAANDHRTRHSHSLMNGRTIGESEFFNVPVYKGDKPTGAVDQMTFPGDPEATASNTINCRCRVVYIPKRDAAGRLIMRNPNTATVITMRSPSSYTPAQIAAQLKSSIEVTVK